MLLVVFGAGASYDSSPTYPPRTNFTNMELRPPLANELFANRDLFTAALGSYPQCNPIVPFLRRAGANVESVLQRLLSESSTDPKRILQLMAVRYYLHLMMWRCEEGWNGVAKGITNHTSLIDQIRHNLRTAEQVLLVTFNYDRMIENALKTVDVVMNSLDDYTRNTTWRLFKLHGSVNWIRKIETPISMANRGNSLEVAHEVINRADQIVVGNRFAITTELADGSG